MDLILPLKKEYFEAIQTGNKNEEYRLCIPYWAKRLEHRRYENIILTLGYPKREDHSRRIMRKWKIDKAPFVVKQIKHPHFGPDAVWVYAIDIS